MNSRVVRGLWTGCLMNCTSLRMLAMLSESFVLAFAMSLDVDADEDDGVLVVFMPSNTEVCGFVSVSV